MSSVSSFSNYSLLILLLLLLQLLRPPFCFAQLSEKNGRGAKRLSALNPTSSEFLSRKDSKCPRFRTFDGVCTSKKLRAAGSVSTALFSYFHVSSVNPTGAHLPSARYISNVVSTQVSHMPGTKGLSEFLVFFGQFLDHTLVASTSSDSEVMPIPIPIDDPIMANFSHGVLEFKRNLRAKASETDPAEHPVNVLPTSADLASVYGPDKLRADALRTFEGGKLKTSGGDMLPFNTEGFFNSPVATADFFFAGDHRVNEHPCLTAFHTLFVREHNLLAAELKVIFRHWKDEKLYQMARQMNIAQFQKIVYEEFLPAMTGRALKPRYRRHKKNTDPSVSVVFAAAAFRVGHTMVGPHVSMRDSGMSPMPNIPAAHMFFNIAPIREHGLEPFFRGAIYTRAQQVDNQVVDTLRNFLFTNVHGESGIDLIALNIQRGRDAGLPPYNEIRRYFTQTEARKFEDISSDVGVQSRLATAYGNVNDVEAWVGLTAEDHMPGAAMGPTLVAIWEKEFQRMRDGDRLFYLHKKLFKRKERRKIPRLGEIYSANSLMAQILYRNTRITPEEVGNSVWYGRD